MDRLKRGFELDSEIHVWRWRGLAVWIAAFTALAIYGYHENRQRVSDIQDSRLTSCFRTYEGVREVLKPFFPSHPVGKQKTTLDKFNKRVDDLKNGCRGQVKIK